MPLLGASEWVIMPAIFLAPNHNHARCSADAIAHAEAVCAERGERLTTLRRLVLEAVASSHRPVGAYEIMDMLAGDKRRPLQSIVLWTF